MATDDADDDDDDDDDDFSEVTTALHPGGQHGLKSR